MSESNENKSSKPVLKATALNFLKPSSFLATNFENKNCSNNQETTNLFKNNPFTKIVSEEDEKPSPEAIEKAPPKNSEDPVKNDCEKKVETTTTPSMPKLGLFSNAGSLAPSSFVFGQNLHERVVGESVSATNSQESEASSEAGTGLLFSSSLSSIKTPDKDKSSDIDSEKSSPLEKASTSEEAAAENSSETAIPAESSTEKVNGCASSEASSSLIEAARKYEEARGSQKRKYEEVETVTGEEDENNILEINCKLFKFVDQNWEERGRGTLRLNDSKNYKYSRVVFRASGNLRVLLNTKVWCDMVCERASQKSLRLTALDANGHAKIYLAMGRNDDITLLYKSLSRRVDTAKTRKNEETPEDTTTDNTPSTSTSNQQEESDEPSPKKIIIEVTDKSE